MRLGIVQFNPHVGAVDKNLEKVLAYIDQARDKGCELVLFPELTLCGSFPADLLWRSGFLGRVEDALERVVRASTGLGIVIGSVFRETQKGGADVLDPSSVADGAGLVLRNSAFFAVDGALVGKEHEFHPPAFDVYNAPRYFTPGEGVQVFEFKGIQLGINICEDLWIDDGPCDLQASLQAKLILSICASPFYAGKGAILRRVTRRRATENDITLVYVNCVGGQDEVVYDGGSHIMGSTGDLLFQAPYFTEDLYVVDLDKLRPVPEPDEEKLVLVRNAINLGIRDYLSKNGFSRVIVGLSGGIDSALLASLAVDALGPDSVLGVSLPSAFTAPENREDAREIASQLGIEFLEMSIEQAVSVHRETLPARPEGLVDENLQARTRGVLLMALANQRNALVLASGNKSEIAVGYNTLYGDTVGALAPLADLYKTEVYELAETLSDRIPERVRKKPPTAELHPGQRDEDDLPPYSLLDPLLRDLIEKNASRKTLLAKGYSVETVDSVLSRYYRSEYKRSQLPPAIKVSPKAFGSGRQMPMTHGYRD